MMNAILPNTLSPKKSEHLVRLGRNTDGGYVIDSRDITKTDCLLSLGLSDDWSFEMDFTNKNDVPIFAFDASIGQSVFIRNFIKSFLRILNLKIFMARLNACLSYKRFFRGDKKHIKSFVGLDIPPEHISMKDVFNAALDNGNTNIFLKIDIEGSEYRILDELIKHADTTTGLAIEFHDCDIHLGSIERFVKDYPLNLVHIHANNNSPLNENGVPLALELTFTSHQPVSGAVQLPHALDVPNNRKIPEYSISFKK